jgi:hypothetical protein
MNVNNVDVGVALWEDDVRDSVWDSVWAGVRDEYR